MRLMILSCAMLVAACSPQETQEASVDTVEAPEPPGAPVEPVANVPAPAIRQGRAWESVASGEGTALRLVNPDGSLAMSVACDAPGRLVVSVPSFSPIGSEDRFAFGLGSEPVTLVADPTRQTVPGVTAEGPVPENFSALLADAADVVALYGTQQVGPHGPPPPELSRLLVEACNDAG